MKNFIPVLNIVFDCLYEPLLLVDENKKPILANPAFLKCVSELTGRKIDLDGISEVIPKKSLVGCNENSLREVQLVGTSETLKLKFFTLPDDLCLLRVVNSFAAEDLKRNLHSQRIETLGMLAGGVAHDFNNILTGLLGHVSYLKNILPQTGSHILSIKAIEDGTRRASSLTQEILNFSRLENSEKPKRINLCDLIERTYHLLRGAISPQFEVSYKVPKDPVFALANEAKIVQIIVNLAMNARDAVERGGFIKIVLSLVTDAKILRRVFGSRDLSTKKYACIQVVDNGHGMTREVLKHVFEPYYTTKKEKGTGLGLAIVSEIVNLFSGAIDIDTEEGKGTIVSVYLPVFEETSEDDHAGNENQRAEMLRGDERILVIDDEFPVRNVLSLSLEHLGYTVSMAASGEEGIELYRQSKEPFDLVILDMLMPNMTGDQVYFRLRELDRAVKVLLISGYSSQESVELVLENGGMGFIQKPFTISELAERVRQCIDVK